MDEDVARRRKIEEGRRRLERIKAKKDGDKPDVPLAKKPLPSPFAVAVRKPLPEFKVPEGRSKAQRPVQGNKENEPGEQADAPERWPAIPQQDSDADKVGGPKTLDDAIDGLRELDRSYTPQVAAVCVCVPPCHHPHTQTHTHTHMRTCTHARTRQVASRLLAAPQQAEGGAEAASRELVADDSAGVGPAAVAVVLATAEESEASASGAPCRGGNAREDAGDGGDAGGDAGEAGGGAGDAGAGGLGAIAGGLGAIAGGRASGYEQAGVGLRAVDGMDGGADVGSEVRMIAGSGAADVVVSSRCETKRCRSVNVWVCRCVGVSVCVCVYTDGDGRGRQEEGLPISRSIDTETETHT